jgi:hypothetical protein
MPFENVTREDFAAAVAESPSSGLFKQQYARFRPSDYEGWDGPDYQICRESISASGTFEAPGFFTLIVGDLHVDGLIDLRNPYDRGFDEGGLCVILGDVTCTAFANEAGKVTFIDGDIHARDLLINAFGDSSLVVMGALKTRFFYGRDIWAEVGGDVSIDYGEGYCLPIGYRDAAAEAIMPKHDETSSLALLNFEDLEILNGSEIRRALREGRPIFR